MAHDVVFQPIVQRGTTFTNRIVMSPMCQYSAADGVPGIWHWAHLSSRAVGGAALVVVESTGVSPEGRITPWDVGLWNDAQEASFGDIVEGIHKFGAKVGIQLSHAGRKASTDAPWRGGGYLSSAQGGWEIVAPSPIPYGQGTPIPHMVSIPEIRQIVEDFVHAARRAARAHFNMIELHAAHGYLIHQFLSPHANQRTDAYGEGLMERVRILLEITRGVREVWPDDRPLWVRLPMTDWLEDGWTLNDAVRVSGMLREIGVDLIDCSSGRINAVARPPENPLYHGPYSKRVRDEIGIATGLVGGIETLEQAESVLTNGLGDMVIVGRALLRDPYLPLRWGDGLWPVQYLRAVKDERMGRDLLSLK